MKIYAKENLVHFSTKFVPKNKFMDYIHLLNIDFG